MRRDVVLSGAGGQGLILAGAVLAEAAGVFEGRHVVQTQSYGTQARGGASQSAVIISDQRIKYPEVSAPDILLCLSQAACNTYLPRLRQAGQLIVDQDLVNVAVERSDVFLVSLPFTARAVSIGHRVVANVVALGALAIVSQVVRPDSLERAIRSRLPERHVESALQALEAGIMMAKDAVHS